MRFDDWTKEEKLELDLEYQRLFGGQIRVMKTLFKSKSDPILLSELLDNVSYNVYQSMEENDLIQTEALIERMFLSTLSYDVLLYKESILNEIYVDLYFYNDYETLEYTEIRIKNVYDMRKLLEMILHIGTTYDKLTKGNTDAVEHISEYHLLDGFETEFELTNLDDPYKKFRN